MTILGLDHVQLAMPEGGEAAARAFYSELLGLAEIAKPASLRDRGGVWFTLGEQQLHLGVQAGFTPAKKAHPALLVDNLDALAARLRAAGHPVIPDHALPGARRLFTEDPFGNRLELIEHRGTPADPREP